MITILKYQAVNYKKEPQFNFHNISWELFHAPISGFPTTATYFYPSISGDAHKLCRKVKGRFLQGFFLLSKSPNKCIDQRKGKIYSVSDIKCRESS